MSVCAGGEAGANDYSMLHSDAEDKNKKTFFSDISLHLFANVQGLFQQVDVWFAEIGVEGSPGSDLGVGDMVGVLPTLLYSSNFVALLCLCMWAFRRVLGKVPE